MRLPLAVFSIVSLLAAGLVSAQTNKKIKAVPLTRTSPASGSEMYRTYCAVCHGVDGRGDGPAASALTKAPADLTQLAIHNNGKFPDARVANAIIGDTQVAAHGSKDMPVWGDLLRSLNLGVSDAVQLRILNLTNYIKTLQAK